VGSPIAQLQPLVAGGSAEELPSIALDDRNQSGKLTVSQRNTTQEQLPYTAEELDAFM